MSYPHGRSGYSMNAGASALQQEFDTAAHAMASGAIAMVRPAPAIMSLCAPHAQPAPWATTAEQSFQAPEFQGTTFEPGGSHTVNGPMGVPAAANPGGPPARHPAYGPSGTDKLQHAAAHAHAHAHALHDAQRHAQQQMAALKEAAAQAQRRDLQTGNLATTFGGRPAPDTGALKRAQAALKRAGKHAEHHRKALEQAQRETTLVAHTEAIKRVRAHAKKIDVSLRQAQRQTSPQQVATVLQKALADADEQYRSLHDALVAIGAARGAYIPLLPAGVASAHFGHPQGTLMMQNTGAAGYLNQPLTAGYTDHLGAAQMQMQPQMQTQPHAVAGAGYYPPGATPGAGYGGW